MPVCADERWDMILKVENATTENHFGFEVKVDNEVISGWVTDDNGNRTELSGRCSRTSAAGQLEVSIMDFRFIVRADNGDVEVLMGGIGFERPAPLKPIFLGQFIAVAPVIGPLPPPAAFTVPIGIDEGDTGTGNGQQT